MSSRELKTWLTRKLEGLNPGDQLPTEAVLGREFNISRSTVRRVLKSFTDSGALERIPGKGTFIPRAEQSAKVELDQAPISSAQAVADQIYRSICNGDLKIGQPLPSIKYMRYRFKVTGQTAIAAYRELVNRGLATKVGKTFWAGTFKELIDQEDRREVYLFNFRSYDYTQLFQHDLLSPAYQAMEKELLACGYLLRYENTRDMGKLFTQWQADKTVPAGLVFPGMNSDRFPHILPAARTYLERIQEDLPAIILDWNTGSFHGELKGVTLLARGSVLTAASRTLAHFLGRHGYQQPVFFFNESGKVWNFPVIYFAMFRILREVFSVSRDAAPQFVIQTAKPVKSHHRYLRANTIPWVLKSMVDDDIKNT
jgi:DNA-binding transcriptional regulator YhcF (GntR family)